jgi:hypothetical protein
MFKRPIHRLLRQRLEEPRRFIQVLAGPRQTGKTTLARQVLEELSLPGHYASADEPALKDHIWIEQQWEAAQRFLSVERPPRAAVLVLDEIQKIPDWSEAVKRLWDQDSARRQPLHVVLLGSAPLLVQQGLSESLAGRFEVIPVTHWSFAEMREAFGWSVEQFIYFGSYPGAAPLIPQPARWRRYILDSLVETTLSRDILLMQRVDKPALLRRLFELGCSYSGQVLSYTKMLGQLQDAGNTVTLAHYLDLLNGAGLLSGLSKYSGHKVRQRGSSPKFIVHNTALISAQSDLSFKQARAQPEYWGRLVESSVGSHLLSASRSGGPELYYWLDRNHEVDFVLARESRVVAIEVKSGLRRTTLPGIAALDQHTKLHRKLLVGGQGIPLDEFLLTDPSRWLR